MTNLKYLHKAESPSLTLCLRIISGVPQTWSHPRTCPQKAWKQECDSKRAKGLKPSLSRALWRAFGAEVMVGGFWKLCWSVFVILGEWLC